MDLLRKPPFTTGRCHSKFWVHYKDNNTYIPPIFLQHFIFIWIRKTKFCLNRICIIKLNSDDRSSYDWTPLLSFLSILIGIYNITIQFITVVLLVSMTIVLGLASSEDLCWFSHISMDNRMVTSEIRELFPLRFVQNQIIIWTKPKWNYSRVISRVYHLISR